MGETYEELIKRYGKPVDQDKNLGALYFERNGYRFEACVLDGITEFFAVSKVNGSPLTKDEASEFIDKNKGNYNYSKTIDSWAALRNFDCDYFVSDDKQRWMVLKSAYPNTIERSSAYLIVSFMTTKYSRWITQTINNNEQRKERERLDKIKRQTEGF